MRITRIETNIKNSELGQRGLDITGNSCILAGMNGSGKTALINAVELALSGEARDLGPRDSAKSSTLLRGLIPPGSDTAYAKVTLDNGSIFEWSVSRSGGVKKHAPPGIKVCFPLREASDAISSSKDKAIRYLYRLSPGYKKSVLDEIDLIKKKAAAARTTSKELETTIKLLSLHKTRIGYSTGALPSVQGKLREELVQIKAEHEAASLSYKRKLEALSDIVENNSAEICYKINKHIPESTNRRVSLIITATEAKFGWMSLYSELKNGSFQTCESDGTPLPFTSGAETIILTLALGLAHTAEIKSKDEILVVLTPPDRSLDMSTLMTLASTPVAIDSATVSSHSFIQTTIRPLHITKHPKCSRVTPLGDATAAFNLHVHDSDVCLVVTGIDKKRRETYATHQVG